MRFCSRSVSLALAAMTVVACSDATGPLDISPEELEGIGATMAVEFVRGALQLTAQNAMETLVFPSFSVHRSNRLPLGAAFNVQRAGSLPSFQAVDRRCGVPSQDPPTDSDADNVPDNLTITFAPPACSVTDAANDTFDLTGVIAISDPTPATAGMAFNMSIDNFRLTLSGAEASDYVRHDELASVTASGSGLSHTVSRGWLTQITGSPTIEVDADWSATFTPAQGSTITPGEPLPDGTYTPNGSFEFREGGRSAHFTVTTVDALQYSAACAADLAGGTYWLPFSSGTVRVAVPNDGDLGYVEITHLVCGQARVLYVSP